MNELFPVCYILMRNDLASMVPGKGMAQSAHASSAFAEDMKLIKVEIKLAELYKLWLATSDQGFGTVLTLGVNEVEMRATVKVVHALDADVVADIIHDPSYPLKDGDFTHYIPLDTCAYVFGDKNDPLLAAVVGNFPLY